MRHCLVVGASAAGMRAAAGLVQGGYDGQVTVIDADPCSPYDRTTLSKGVLSGWQDFRDTALGVADGLEVLHGVRAHRLDTSRRVLETDMGTMSYTELVLACGATAKLPAAWAGNARVKTLRTASDALELGRAAVAGSRVAVIGAGVLGMEIATSLASRKCRVEVFEAANCPLERVLPAEIGALIAARAADRGIDLSCGVGVHSVASGLDDVRIDLADGRRVISDVVVAALGNRPATDWLLDSGLVIDDGVICDDALRTNEPGVWVAGDVARVRGTSGRSEHWTRAGQHGSYVAQAILGQTDDPFDALPYVWSDVVGTRVQIFGVMDAPSRITIRGSADADQVAVLSVRDGSVVGVAALGWQRVAMEARRRLGHRLTADEFRSFLPLHVPVEAAMNGHA